MALVTSAKREHVEEDFIRLSSSLQAALKLAKEHVRTRYKTEDVMEQAFYHT